MIALASLLVLAQAPAAAPQRAAGCAALAIELDSAINLDDGGYARAREACYEQLALGLTRADIGRAMRDYVTTVAASPAADPGGPVPGDGWIALLPPPPAAVVVEQMRMRPSIAQIPSLELHYWGSCDGRGPHGTCDQMGRISFRMGPEFWAEIRYFDLYSDADTVGAAGLGLADEEELFGISAGIWAGTWARDCRAEVCKAGGEFVLPYATGRIGPPLIFVEASVADGPYIASGHTRLELGHRFLDGSQLEAGVTAGILGRGAAARADARVMVIRHIALDLYGSVGASSFALGAGAGFRY